MITLKRTLITVVVLAVVFGAVGIMTASAQDQDTTPSEAGAVWLGVTIADTDDGVTIRQVVPDSPADEAGLRRGDIIQAVDGTEVESAEKLIETIQAHAPGDEITLTVSWRGEARDVAVTLAERPAETEAEIEVITPSFEFGMEPRFALLNVLGLDTTSQDDGLLINSIAADSPLADSGLQAGDVITEINGESVLDRQRAMMFRFRSDEPMVFTVLRDGEEMEIEADVQFPGWPEHLQVMPMAPGLGFAFGQARPTQLGIQFRTLTPDYAQEEGLPVEQGALVVEVYEDTPAAQAGLQVDDIITAVSGDPLDEERTLADRLVAYEEGDMVTLAVLRGGEEIQIHVTLGPRAPQQMTVPGWFAGPNMGPRQGSGGMFHFHHDIPIVPAPVEPAPEGPIT
jgi:S1-C subfamily serine protease